MSKFNPIAFMFDWFNVHDLCVAFAFILAQWYNDFRVRVEVCWFYSLIFQYIEQMKLDLNLNGQ